MTSPGRARFTVERWTIRLAPALGMAAISASALLMTEAEPRWAQVFSGRTDSSGPVAWRVQVKRGSLERQLPATGHVTLTVAFPDGSHLERDATVDEDGIAWMMFARPASRLHEPLQVTVRENSRVLAKGPVFVPERHWQNSERLEGGWCAGHREGNREIRVGVVNGVLLHSVPGPLIVTLSEDGHALGHERLSVTAEGAEILRDGDTSPTNPVDLVTNEYGIAHFSLRATDLAATLRVTSRSPNESSFAGALPIRAGGLAVAQTDHALVITSPIGLERATIGLLTEHGLVDVKTLRLEHNGATSSARVGYPVWPAKPLWAMVSSETQLDAGNTIGWPLLDGESSREAHPSRVVPNSLVLDGYRTVSARLERQHRQAYTTSMGALLLVGALLVWAVIHGNRQNRRQLGPLERLLDEEGSTSVAERTPYALIAVVVITAATVALTWWLSLAR